MGIMLILVIYNTIGDSTGGLEGAQAPPVEKKVFKNIGEKL